MNETTMNSHPLSASSEYNSAPRENDFESRVTLDETSDKPQSIELLIDGDPQHDYYTQTSFITSLVYDAQSSASSRKEASRVFLPILQRQSESTLRQSSQSEITHRFQLGDIMNVSNIQEWIMYLYTLHSDLNIDCHLGLPDDWYNLSEDQLFAHFEKNPIDWEEILRRLKEEYSERHLQVIKGVLGNHDGEFFGNLYRQPERFRHHILNHFQISYKKMQYVWMSRFYDEEGSSQLSERTQKIKEEISDLESKTPPLSQELKLIFMKYEWMRLLSIKNRLEDKKKDLNEHDQKRYEYVLTRLNEINEVLRNENMDLPPLFGKCRIPSPLLTGFLQRPWRAQNFSESSAWSEMSDGHPFSKEDVTQEYYEMIYPELYDSESNQNGVSPLATAIIETPLTLQDGIATRPQQSSMNHVASLQNNNERLPHVSADDYALFNINEINEENVTHLFNMFWTEIRSGEYFSQIYYPERDPSMPNHRFITLQAFELGHLSEYDLYSLMIDGQDSTDEFSEIGYYATFSRISAFAFRVFIDYQKYVNNKKPLCIPVSHHQLGQFTQDYWKEFQNDDFFSMPEIAPLQICGHGHRSMIINQNQRQILGMPFIIGRKAVRREDTFFTAMAASTTDAPNENLKITLTENFETHRIDVHIEFLPVVANDEYENASPLVLQSLEDIRPQLSPQAEDNVSQLRLNPISGVYNIFFRKDKIIAYDSIPLSKHQYEQSLIYCQKVCELYEAEYGPDAIETLKIKKIYAGLKKHYDLWLHGDGLNDDFYKRVGYEEGLKYIQRLSPKRAIKFLQHYTDIFDTPFYFMWRTFVTQIPQNSLAYQVCLLAGKEAAMNESKHHKDRRFKEEPFSYDMQMGY